METATLTEAILFVILLVGIYTAFVLTAIVFKVKEHDDNFTLKMGNVQSALGAAYEDKNQAEEEAGLALVEAGGLKLRDVKRATD